MGLFDFDVAPDRYAVIGNPISHSKSPFIHTEFARQTGQRMEYTAIQVDAGGFDQAVGNFQASGGKGLNITVPFKQEAWRLVDSHSPDATRAGAVNTIVFQDDGRLHGDNTDGIGLIQDICINHQYQIRGQRVLLMGAGGAARGILQPLLNEGPSQLVIANRTADRASALATDYNNEIAVTGIGYPELQGRQFDLIINATAASLQGQLPPLPDNILAPQACCYDLMYAREPTVFLQWAQQHNADLCLDGLGMLVEQAAAAFELWRRVRPDSIAVIRLLREQ
jgi:shikimate dehydrogenase